MLNLTSKKFWTGAAVTAGVVFLTAYVTHRYFPESYAADVLRGNP